MVTTRIPRDDWQGYFDRVTHSLRGVQSTIEVSSPSFGDQIEADSTRLYGITFDPKSDVLEVATEAIDHMIPAPTEIEVQMDGVLLRAINVSCESDRKEVIHLIHPLRIGF